MYTPTRTYMKKQGEAKKPRYYLFTIGLIAVVAVVLMSRSNNLGGTITTSTYTEVPREVATYLSPTYEYEFRDDKTGDTLVQQVTQGEYDTWLHGSMTVPGYPVPTMKGATFVRAVGGKENRVVSEPVLTDKQYITLVEPTATQTPSYKTATGITSVKPI